MGNERRMRYARSRRKTDSKEERKRLGKRENARWGKEDTKRKAKRKGVRENGYEPSMEFEACLNRLQLPERVDWGYWGEGGCYDDHAPSNYAKIALRTLDPSSIPLPPSVLSLSPSYLIHPSSGLQSFQSPLPSPRRVANVSEDKRLAELCFSMNLLELAIPFVERNGA